MVHARHLRLLPLLVTTLLAGAACTAPPDGDDAVAEDEGELKKLPAASVLGTIAYGETKKITVATAAYRALSFTGKAGDEIKADLVASAAKLDGMWLTTSTFANLAVSLATAGSPRLSATAKLPADGTYYLVFRQRTSVAVTHDITLSNNLAKPDVGLTASTITTEGDGLAKVSFPGRQGDRFRIMLWNGNVDVSPRSTAKLVGCANQDVWVGQVDFATTDVAVTSTATCTLQVGSAGFSGTPRSFQASIVRLDDPERAAYVKSLECAGPELPLSSLAAAMPEATSRLFIMPRDGLRGRKRTCHPVTGCSLYQPLPTAGWSYSLLATDGGLKIRATDEQLFAYELDFATSRYGRHGETVKVKATAGCLSLTSDAPDYAGLDHVVRFDLPAAPRTPDVEPALTAACSGAPLTEAQMAGLFAPGTSERDFNLPTDKAKRSCNRVSGCTQWGPITSSTTALSFRIDGQGKPAAHWGLGWQPMQGGTIMLNGLAIGKVTASCIDLTQDVRSPSGTNDGNYVNERSRKVGPR